MYGKRYCYTTPDLFFFLRIVDHKPELLRVKKPVQTPCDKQKTVWKTMFTGPLALLSVALSSASNPFPSMDQLSGKKCISWTPAIRLELIKDIKVRTGMPVKLSKLALCMLRVTQNTSPGQ